MYSDNDLDKDALRACVADRYGLPLKGLTFLPKGEMSYGYLGTTEGDRRVFVKLRVGADHEPLKTGVRTAERLCRIFGFDAALSPIRTRDGDLWTSFGTHLVTLYPYVDGPSLDEVKPSAEELRRAAQMIARLHSCAGGFDDVPVPRESYTNRHLATLEALIVRAELPRRPVAHYEKRVAEALAEDAVHLRAAFTTYRELAEYARRCRRRVVLTHGDPNFANILRGREGRLYLIDWDSVALGPPEHDLLFFTGDDFRLFLAEYLRAASLRAYDPGPLDVRLFAYYIYDWCFGEIGSYSIRIFRRNRDDEQNKHDLREFEQYVPFQLESITTGIEKIERILQELRHKALTT